MHPPKKISFFDITDQLNTARPLLALGRALDWQSERLTLSRRLTMGYTSDGPLGKAGGDAGRGHNMDHFCLAVYNYDQQQMTAFCHAHHIEVSREAERYGAEGLGPFIYLTDPEGNMLELKKKQWAAPSQTRCKVRP